LFTNCTDAAMHSIAADCLLSQDRGQTSEEAAIANLLSSWLLVGYRQNGPLKDGGDDE